MGHLLATTDDAHVLDPDVSRSREPRPATRDGIPGALDVDRRALAHAHRQDAAGVERSLRKWAQEPLLLRAALLPAFFGVELVQQRLGELVQRAAAGDRRHLLEANAPTPRFDAALVMTLPRTGETRLEEIMTGQRLEAHAELAVRERDPLHRRAKIIVDRAAGDAAAVGESPEMAIKEGQLVAALVQPTEVAARVHQAQHEPPHLPPLAVDLDDVLEEVDLDLVARTMDEGDVDLGRSSALLPQIGSDQRHADVVALLHQFSVQPRACHALLRGRPLAPLPDQFVHALLYSLKDRTAPRLLLHPPGLRHLQVAPHGVAADAHLPRDLSRALPFDQHFVPDHVHLGQLEHPLPRRPASRLPSSDGIAGGSLSGR